MTQCEFCDSPEGKWHDIGDGMWFCDECESRLSNTGRVIADIFRGAVLEVELRQLLSRLERNDP